MQQIPWSTPLKNYKTIDGHQLPGDAETIYNYPDHELNYGNFRLTSVADNGK